MWKDPIIEEIHQTLEKLWRDSGENLQSYCERLKRIEEQHKDRLVTPEELASLKRREQVTRKD